MKRDNFRNLLALLLIYLIAKVTPQSQFNPSFGTPPSSSQQQYGNQGPPYNTNPNNDPYGNNQNPQYGGQNSQYGGNNNNNSNRPFGNGPYGNNNNNYNGNNPPYNPNNPQYNGNNNNNNPNSQYGGSGGQYGGQGAGQYGNNNSQNPQFGGGNSPPYGQYYNQSGGGNYNPQYGTNPPPHYGIGSNSNQPQYGGNNYNNQPQYGPGNNQPQYGGNVPPPYNPSQQGGGSQYNPNNQNNNDNYGSGNSNYGGGSSINNNRQDDCCPEYCYTTDENKYLSFATKTAYEVVYGKQQNQHRVPDCEAIQFWSINRHGTRYPSARSIQRLRQLNRIRDDIIRNYDERRSYPDRGRLCPQDIELLKRWRWNDTVTEQRANALTMQGIQDVKFLARRYHSKFDGIFREPYSQQAYTFQYTDTDSTHDSYQAYIEGLFRNNAYQVHANMFSNENLLKPTSTCNSWRREVDDNPQSLQEYLRFKRKQEYQQMVRDVFRRLGFRYTLNDSLIDDMYDLCRYEKAWDLGHHSAWCSVFNKEQLKILEYAEDLKYYYKEGYGSDLNRRIGCPAVKDLYEKFQRTVNQNPDGNKVSVYFTHSVTFLTFLTAMGIAKDFTPLTADSYYQHQGRSWRTSSIDPFAANLVATLYKCNSGERYRVMFFLNENPVNYPDCSVGLCNWSTVKNKLELVAQECNLDFCDQNAAIGLLQLNSVIPIVISSLVLALNLFRH